LYILLSGKPPFSGDNDSEILRAVKEGKYSMNGPEWKGISNEAKDLINRMLKEDPILRISAYEALEHEWIKKKVHEILDIEATYNALNNLRHFRVINF